MSRWFSWIRSPTALVAARRRVRSIARKELRQLRRDRLTMGFVVGVPIFQLMLFGYAINQDVRHVPTALVDQDPSHVTRRVVGQLEASQTFEITHRTSSEEAAESALRAGEVQVVLVIPADFTRAYYRGRGAELSIRVNATDPLQARAVKASAEGLMQQLNAHLEPFLVEAPRASPGEASFGTRRSPRTRESFFVEPDLVRDEYVRFSVLSLYNPEVRTAVFVVPGLLGVILTTTMILMTALALVRERERGTFEFLIATPVRRAELMIGKILPYIGIGLIQIVLVVSIGVALFRVPVEGSLLALGVTSLLFIAANLTLGLVISSTTATQLQATQLSFFVFLPSVMLSGFMFPYETMPVPVQWLGELLPLTHYIRLVRGILLRGAGLSELATDAGALAVFTLVGLIIASRLFHKRLD